MNFHFTATSELQLMGSHSPGSGEPAALQYVVDAYLRLNRHDDEVREVRERQVGTGERFGT